MWKSGKLEKIKIEHYGKARLKLHESNSRSAMFPCQPVDDLAVGNVSSQGTDLAYQSRMSDSVTITYYTPSGSEKVRFADREWQERLAEILENSSYEPREHCLCVSYPKIEFSNKGRYLGRLSVHHGEKIRVVGGDYFVGAETGKAINNIAFEKRYSKSTD